MRRVFVLSGVVVLSLLSVAAIKFFTDYPNSVPVDSDFFVLQRNQSYINASRAQVKNDWFTSPVFTGNGSIAGSFSAGGIYYGNGAGLTNVPGISGNFFAATNGVGQNPTFYGGGSLFGAWYFDEVDTPNFYPTNLFTGKTNAVLLSTDGDGLLSTTTFLAATNNDTVVSNGLYAQITGTLATGTVSSICIPMGAWYTNNVGDGASLTGASSLTPTNSGDCFVFADSVTNCARTRFSLPWDWDGQAVRIGVLAMCTGTNSATTGNTNVVFNLRAASNDTVDSFAQPTFGTGVWTTNGVGPGAYTNRLAITTDLTIGNSPSAGKSILWEIQRLGAQTGDTLTNSSLCVTEVRVYYKRNTRADYPTATP